MILVTFVSAYRRRIAEKGSTEQDQKEDKTVSWEILSMSSYSILEKDSNDVMEIIYTLPYLYTYLLFWEGFTVCSLSA